MTLFLLVLSLVVIAMALMGVGSMLTRRPLQRGCGKEVGEGSCSCAKIKAKQPTQSGRIS